MRRKKLNVSDVRREHTRSVLCPGSRVFLLRRKRLYPSPEVGLSLWKRSKKRHGSSSYNFFEPQHLLYTHRRANKKKRGVGVSQVLNSDGRRERNGVPRVGSCGRIKVMRRVPALLLETVTAVEPDLKSLSVVDIVKSLKDDPFLLCKRPSGKADGSECANFQRQIHATRSKYCSGQVPVIDCLELHERIHVDTFAPWIQTLLGDIR